MTIFAVMTDAPVATTETLALSRMALFEIEASVSTSMTLDTAAPAPLTATLLPGDRLAATEAAAPIALMTALLSALTLSAPVVLSVA